MFIRFQQVKLSIFIHRYGNLLHCIYNIYIYMFVCVFKLSFHAEPRYRDHIFNLQAPSRGVVTIQLQTWFTLAWFVNFTIIIWDRFKI